MTRRIAFVLAVAIVAAAQSHAHAYLKFGYRVGNQTVDVRWPALPMRYFISERGAPGVSPSDLRGAAASAAATWQGVPGTTIRFEDLGFTTAAPIGLDGRSTLGFLDRPDLDRVLGATSLILDATSGAIVEADIFFNTAFPWSVAAQGEAGRVDLESVAVHELGHFMGLGHSAIGETERTASGGRRVLGTGAVMFPIALTAGSTADRVLQDDDEAAVQDLYAADTTRAGSGTITGRVTKNGAGVFGAHVIAFNPETGRLVGGFSLSADGGFVIAGLDPGPHIVRAEPLDDADVESFLAGDVDVGFRAAFASRMVVAPSGGSSGAIEIQVVAK